MVDFFSFDRVIAQTNVVGFAVDSDVLKQKYDSDGETKEFYSRESDGVSHNVPGQALAPDARNELSSRLIHPLKGRTFYKLIMKNSSI